MKKIFALLFACVAISADSNAQTTKHPNSEAGAPNLIKYVKPIIGTQRMGHVYPGATVPFGMVQLSPETDTVGYEKNGKYNPDVYKYCAGYQYDDKTIIGFSHTLLR